MIIGQQNAVSILLRLFEISIYSFVIFFVILGFRAVFRQKASPALRYGLWFLLLIRLSMPITVSSGVHLIILPAKASQTAVTPAAVNAAAPRSDLPPAPADSQITIAPDDTASDRNAHGKENPGGSTVRRLSIPQILVSVWLAGGLLFLLRDQIMAYRLRKRLKRFSALPCERIRKEFEMMLREIGIRSRIQLLQLQDISSPALTIGFLPKVLLPESLCWSGQEKNRTLAIKHELTHMKRLDHLVMIWITVLRVIWWFLPVVWMMEKPLRMDMESACDAKVVAGMTKEEKLYYAGLLLELGKEFGI